MADITWSDVTGMFPTDVVLVGLSVPAQNFILARVNKLSAAYFGGVNDPKYALARIYLAAHFGLLPGLTGHGVAGPVTAESEGGVARQYAVIGLNAYGQHSSTGYGQLFDELVRSSPSRVGLIS
jgi:hypothetical protein